GAARNPMRMDDHRCAISEGAGVPASVPAERVFACRDAAHVARSRFSRGTDLGHAVRRALPPRILAPDHTGAPPHAFSAFNSAIGPLQSASGLPRRPNGLAIRQRNELHFVARHDIETRGLPVSLCLLDAVLARGHEIPPDVTWPFERGTADNGDMALRHGFH